jgi:hypothetical protein
LGYVGHGLWSGCMSVVAGGFGIGVARKATKCQMCAFLVLYLTAASVCLVQFCVAVAGASSVGNKYNGCCSGACLPPLNDKGCREYKVIVAMESMLAILGLIGAAAAIWGFALRCTTACCCKCYCCFESGVPNQPPPLAADQRYTQPRSLTSHHVITHWPASQRQEQQNGNALGYFDDPPPPYQSQQHIACCPQSQMHSY